MKVLVDLNVLLDVIQKREPHLQASASILSLVAEGEIRGAVAGHAVTTIYYLVEKYGDKAAADLAVDWILSELEIIAESRDLFLRARALEMVDFEDAVVASAAETVDCDWIVTRNAEDFKKSPVPPVTPGELVASASPKG